MKVKPARLPAAGIGARRLAFRRRPAAGLPACLAILVLTLPAHADDRPRTIFGSQGLIEMPNARMSQDGELSLGVSVFENTQHYNFGFQALPWLEASFRYTGMQHFLYPQFPTYYDRSFALKARLWNEGDILPTISLGIDDLVGTGIYSGEYLVASKQIGDFDATLGVGWGRLGSTNFFRNPLTEISNSFVSRPGITNPGEANFQVFFHGPASGLFGGVTWQTPVTHLSLSAEYSSDVYTLERNSGAFNPHSQWNFGASYQPFDGMTLGLAWLHGESLEGSLSFQLDPTRSHYPTKIAPDRLPLHVRDPDEQRQALNLMTTSRTGILIRRPSPPSSAAKNSFVDHLMDGADYTDIQTRGRTLLLSRLSGADRKSCQQAAQLAQKYGGGFDAIKVQSGRQSATCTVSQLQSATYVATIGPAISGTPRDDDAAIRHIRADAAEQMLSIVTISLGISDATLYYTNDHYQSETDALGRLTRVLMADAPADIEKFRLISVHEGVPDREFDVLRGPMERDLSQQGSADLWENAISDTGAPLQDQLLDIAERGTYPRLSWEIIPQIRQSLFDPDNPFAVQFLTSADVTVDILRGLSLTGGAEVSLYDNFNRDRPDDSLLPHVRSDFLSYFIKGRTGISNLQADYRFRLSPNIFATIKVGYLESMFAGVGGEVLWRPEGQRWALGGDLYEVQQRNFDRLFGLQNYKVLTGHIAIYYQSPWYGMNFAVRAGQYLASDRGITFEISRRFASGVEIGAFATKTNVSAAQFGEGSFDKGIIIRIPIGWALPLETQSAFATELRPVQRDGGQRLFGDATLYDETRRSSLAEIRDHFSDLGEN